MADYAAHQAVVDKEKREKAQKVLKMHLQNKVRAMLRHNKLGRPKTFISNQSVQRGQSYCSIIVTPIKAGVDASAKTSPLRSPNRKPTTLNVSLGAGEPEVTVELGLLPTFAGDSDFFRTIEPRLS